MSTPSLTPDIVADETALDIALDKVLRHEPRQRAYLRGVLRATEALRRKTTPEAWELYLILDARVNARLADAMRIAVRWAFHEGRRHPLPCHA